MIHTIKIRSSYSVLYCQHLAQSLIAKKIFLIENIIRWMNRWVLLECKYLFIFSNQMIFCLPKITCSKNLGCLWRKTSVVCFSIVFLYESKSLLNF